MFIKVKRRGKKLVFYLARSKRVGPKTRQSLVYLSDTLSLTATQWEKVCAKGFRPTIWEVAPVVEKFVSRHNLPYSTLVGLREAMSNVSLQSFRSRPTSAHRALELNPVATPDEILSAYRRLAQIHHSDHGGTDQKMRQLTAARDKLLAPTLFSNVPPQGVK